MPDDDTDDLRPALHSDPRVLLATTLATLVIAGSAYMWRSLPNMVGSSPQQGVCTGPDSAVVLDGFAGSEIKLRAKPGGRPISPSVTDDRGELTDHEETNEVKIARSKERRRRGKDPLKEMLKNAKKNKNIFSPNRALEQDATGLSKAGESSRHSSEPPPSSSSRSSSVSISKKRTPVPKEWAGPDYNASLDQRTVADGDEGAKGRIDTISPAPKSSLTALSGASAASVIASQSSGSSSSSSQASDLSHIPDFPSISLPVSSGTSQSGSTPSSESVITPNTSPAVSPTAKTTPLSRAESPQPKQQMSPSKPEPIATNDPSSRKIPKPLPGPWDWDGLGPSVPADVTSPRIKPPRFRSRSRGSGSTPSIPELTTLLDPPAESAIDPFVTSNKGYISALDELTFPTLNASRPSSTTLCSPGPSRTGSYINGTTSGSNGTGSTPRRAPTPRRPSTPHSGTSTPPPSVSAQTQLASMRGALEAARMREEKAKYEMDKFSKDLEGLRYELAASRRREVELQTQVRYLMHSQSYAQLFSPTLPPNSGNNPATSGQSANAPVTYTSASNQQPTLAHLQLPSPASMFLANGILSSPPILSPMSMGSHHPFYPYPPQSPHHASHLPPQQQQASLFSMLYPQRTSASNGSSRPPSTVGSSSVGSQSPDLPGSSNPPSTLFDRGRTRRPGNREGEDGTDGWIVNDEEYVGGRADPYVAISDDDDEEDGGFSEVLADAILKRPGSIRGLSSRKSKDKIKENKEAVQHVEFTFPSISNLGNPVARGGWGASVEVAAPVEGGPVSEEVKEEDGMESCEETPRVEGPSRKTIESGVVLAGAEDQVLVAASDVAS